LDFREEPLGHLLLPIDLGLVSKGGPFSVALWFRSGPPTREYTTIIDAGGHRGFTIRVGSRRRISASLDEKWNLMNDTNSILEGVWIHVAATFDGKTFRLYVEGKEIAAHEIEAPLRMAPHLQIGSIRERIRLPDGSGDDVLAKPTDGAIDDLKVYLRALSAAEIAAAASPPGK
jgi:hypothetical protein